MSSRLCEASPTPAPDPLERLRLRAGERDAWERDGFFVRRGVFGERSLRALRAAARRVEAIVRSWDGQGRAYRVDGLRFRDVGDATLQYEHYPEGTARARVVEPVHHLAPFFDKIVDDVRLSVPAADLVGDSAVALFTDKLNLKSAGVGSAFDWHQDAPYWAHVPGVSQRLGELPNALIQIDTADQGNGCFRVRPGSHRAGLLPAKRDGGALAPLFVEPSALARYRETPLPMEAGSVAFFHPRLVHGSEANRSDRPRRALVLTYQAAGLRMFKRDRVRDVAGLPLRTKTRR